ncbi:DUF3558 family protein [Saccharomonospora glauca]|uniref:DUF3558 domain-containing protein n=1 Tax=Saccharomonospora glauca K62 TaxID=928724 RepID=I1D423_9PSEU|nr:DUF3558 family protein [Saccharomonospora glauca]EIE99697.1 Protein of unknown function (DUF3558) [Saccharomonospora glauca K62]
MGVDVRVRALGGRLAPVVVGLLVATAGCGVSERGLEAAADAKGGEDPEGVNSAPTTVPTTRSSPGEAELDPCALLDARDRSSVGLTSPGEPITVAGSLACDYVEPGSFGVTVTVDDHTDLAAIRARTPEAEELRVGATPALLIADRAVDDGTCSVSLAAESPGVRTIHIDVTTADFRDTERACTRATTVAELIEPEVA